MTVDEFIRTCRDPEEIRGAIWAETALTPVLSALDRIRLQQELERRK